MVERDGLANTLRRMTSPWEVFYEGLPLLAAPYGGGLARTVAVGLRGGGLAVVSPGPRADEARAALERWGPVRFLLAPNHFHLSLIHI